MRLIIALVIITLSACSVSADRVWINHISVDENNMIWGYTETFSGFDSMVYRLSIDEAGNNDSFITAWELLNADKNIRREFRKAIDNEPDVRIDNLTSKVLVIDIESSLSPGIIGNINMNDSIVNRYNVKYGFEENIFDAKSIWFLGQANSPVTIVMPKGIDVINITGMKNVTKKVTDHTEILGYFVGTSGDRSEISLSLKKNTSMNVQKKAATNISFTPVPENNTLKPMMEIVSKVRDITLIILILSIALLVYFFKIRTR